MNLVGQRNVLGRGLEGINVARPPRLQQDDDAVAVLLCWVKIQV